jgi:hypothetical protein
LVDIDDLEKIAEQFFSYLFLGALRGYPPLRREAEKPEALKRGGLPPFL